MAALQFGAHFAGLGAAVEEADAAEEALVVAGEGVLFFRNFQEDVEVIGHDAEGEDLDLAKGLAFAEEGDELLLLDPERQVQVDRHPARRQTGDRGVRGEDVHREPCRALPAVLRHDEHRVAGHRHDLAAADLDDADVDAVLRRDQDRGIVAAEPGIDDLLEDLRGDLADLVQFVADVSCSAR